MTPKAKPVEAWAIINPTYDVPRIEWVDLQAFVPEECWRTFANYREHEDRWNSQIHNLMEIGYRCVRVRVEECDGSTRD